MERDGTVFETMGVSSEYVVGGWKKGQPGRALWFKVATTLEKDGTYSAVALNLPGVGSIGNTEEEAVHNFFDAARAACQVYWDAGQMVPFIPVRVREYKLRML